MSGEQIAHRTFKGTCSMEGAVLDNCGQGTVRRFAQNVFYE
ncbi:MAG: hypothetical protein ABSH25_04145 [Syntrophorhabdales bacterium]|jgi:hypothetical protein